MSVPRRNLNVARRRLETATAALAAEPTATLLRRARAAAMGAVESIDAHVEAIMAAESERNKSLARQLAKGRKDARGRKRPPQTMPGYHKGRVSRRACVSVEGK